MNGKNENTGKFIPGFFIVTGIVIVLCGLFQELTAADRIIALAVGVTGIIGTIARLFLVRSQQFCRATASDDSGTAGNS